MKPNRESIYFEEGTMKVIGITGGIGSGKTAVTKILQEEYGAYLANTDNIAKRLMEPGNATYEDVVYYFGEDILTEDQTIDSKKLSKIVFNDKSKLRVLNELTHPKVLDRVRQEILKKEEEGQKYFIIETALMIESGYDYICDEVWYVYAPESKRRELLKKSRNYSDEKIDLIFNSQSKDEEFRKRFSIVINNDGDLEQLKEQVKKTMKTRDEA